MNKKLVMGGILFVVLIGVVFALGLHFSSPSYSVSKSVVELGSGDSKPQKCILQNNAKFKGEAYLNAGQTRLDIRDANNTIHFVIGNAIVTQWQDDNNEGARMRVDEVIAFDFNAKNNFLCSSWIVDQSVFVPPVQKIYFASNKIKDMDKTKGTADVCKVCEGLQAEALQTCRKQLNCS